LNVLVPLIIRAIIRVGGGSDVLTQLLEDLLDLGSLLDVILIGTLKDLDILGRVGFLFEGPDEVMRMHDLLEDLIMIHGFLGLLGLRFHIDILLVDLALLNLLNMIVCLMDLSNSRLSETGNGFLTVTRLFNRAFESDNFMRHSLEFIRRSLYFLG